MASPGGLFYVYEHWRPDTDVCFYVGKGCGRRILRVHRKNAYHTYVVAKLARSGLCAEVRLVAGGLSETESFALEIERIAFWRAAGAKLANATAGGEGNAGTVRTPAQRQRVSAANKGLKRSEATRAKMRAAFKGRVVSAETRAKISAALKGRPTGRKGVPLTAEAKKKMSEAGKLRGAPKHPPEVIEKIAAAHRGRKRTLETCAKIAAAALGRPSSTKGKPSPLKGRTLSEAVKTKMSEAAKLRWSLQREKEYLT